MERARAAAVVLVLMGTAGGAAARPAEPLAVSEELELVSLAGYLDYLVDRERALEVAAVLAGAHDDDFVPLRSGERLEFGYTDAALWVRFALSNPTPRPIEVLVDVGYPSLDRIALYTPRPGGGFEEMVTGDDLPLASRLVQTRKFLFPVDLQPGATERYYARITTTSSLAVPVRVAALKPYLERVHDRQLLLGIFYGVLVGSLLSYLVVLLFVPRAIYFYYVAHVLVLILGFACLDGLAPRLWPRATTWNHFIIHFVVYLLAAILILFVRRFMDTPSVYPKLDRWLRGAAWTILATLPLTAVLPHALRARLALGALALTGLVLAVIVFRRAWSGYRPAQIYSLAWAGLSGSIAYGAAANLDLVPGYIFAVEVGRAAIGLEVVLSGLALVQRLADVQRALVREERAAAAAREELITALRDKNRELESFSYSVSHDLRGPLVTIKGFLGWLARDVAGGDAGRQRADIEQIGSAVDQMSARLQEILALSRSGRVIDAPRPVALTAAAREAAELLAGELGARRVEVDIDPDLPRVQGDHGRLVQVMQNLLENAIKFMGDQPHPRIEIGVQQAPPRVRGGDEQVVFVRDNGIGIEPRFLERIFGLFDRLDSEVPSTGIGLAIVRRIVEAHGGRVWAESAGPGCGATFFVAFAGPAGSTLVSGRPRTAATSSPADPDPPAAASGLGGSRGGGG